MNHAFSRCSNAFLPEEVINMYINGLTLAINSLVQRFRDTHEGCTYMDVAPQAMSEGDALRTRTAPIPRKAVPRTTLVKQTRTVNMTQPSSKSAYGQHILGNEEAVAHPIDDYHDPTVIHSSTIPSTTLSRKSKERGHDNQF